MDELEKIRNEINQVDETILEALASRRKLAERIIQTKDQLGAPIRDASREEQLLENLIAMLETVHAKNPNALFSRRKA